MSPCAGHLHGQWGPRRDEAEASSDCPVKGEGGWAFIRNAHPSVVEARTSDRHPPGTDLVTCCVHTEHTGPRQRPQVLEAGSHRHVQSCPPGCRQSSSVAEGDHSRHRCWPRNPRGGKRKGGTSQHLQRAGHWTHISTFNLVFIIPILQMQTQVQRGNVICFW